MAEKGSKSPYYQPEAPVKSPYYPVVPDEGSLPKNDAEEQAYTDWLDDQGEDTSKR